VDLDGSTGRDKRRTLLTAIAIAFAVFILAAPVVQAAVQKVKLAGGSATAKIVDSSGATIESKAIPAMGLFQAPGSDGAVATRNYPGGGGVLGVGDCTASTDPAQGPLPNTVTVPGGKVVTALIMTGTGTVQITSDAIGQGQLPVSNFKTDANNPNLAITLGTGLSTTVPLKFTGVDGTACNFIVLGI
jgi:hypothetical protein